MTVKWNLSILLYVWAYFTYINKQMALDILYFFKYLLEF